MKILIIGGTYFLGKAFLELCDDGKNVITVLNRGNKKISSNRDGHVREIHADRRDAKALEAVREKFDPEGYDCVVDFCAYEPGDLRMVLNAISRGAEGFIKQYVFISTCDVYRRGTGETLTESAELESREFGGPEGAYVSGKVALERELCECAALMGFHYTSVRPAFIYGPDNYAPREDMFFQWISKAGQVLFPEDADGSFQMIYVKDLAKVIRACLLNPYAYDGAINACGDVLDYRKFLDALEWAVGKPIERLGISVTDALERGIPLPFPLTKEESERYGSEKAKKLGIRFITPKDGLKETYAWFLAARK